MYLVLRAKEPARITSEFLHHLGCLKSTYRSLLESSHGVHIEKMTFDPKKYLRTTIHMPPSVHEQERIVAVLQSLDHEIVLLGQLRAAYAQQKRGLMQRLLSGDVSLPAASPPAASAYA